MKVTVVPTRGSVEWKVTTATSAFALLLMPELGYGPSRYFVLGEGERVLGDGTFEFEGMWWTREVAVDVLTLLIDKCVPNHGEIEIR